jgi:hypothetical protein
MISLRYSFIIHYTLNGERWHLQLPPYPDNAILSAVHLRLRRLVKVGHLSEEESKRQYQLCKDTVIARRELLRDEKLTGAYSEQCRLRLK